MRVSRVPIQLLAGGIQFAPPDTSFNWQELDARQSCRQIAAAAHWNGSRPQLGDRHSAFQQNKYLFAAVSAIHAIGKVAGSFGNRYLGHYHFSPQSSPSVMIVTVLPLSAGLTKIVRLAVPRVRFRIADLAATRSSPSDFHPCAASSFENSAASA